MGRTTTGPALLAGGGTAGHVLPALAIADALVRRGWPASSVRFVGAPRGMETELVPSAGYTLDLLPVTNFPRRHPARMAAAAARLVMSLPLAWRLVGRLRPSVVVSVGGYASVPCVLAARVRRIPVVAVSYDAVPGAASRVAGRLAEASAVAFESSPLPRKELTGTPVRAEVLAVDTAHDRATARDALGLPHDRFVLLAVGGSLGSASINDAVFGLVRAHLGDATLAVRHVVGRRYEADARAGAPVPPPGGVIHQIVGFEEHMERAYAAADLVLARAGAMTVAELSAVGVPAILSPWPGAADRHQDANAAEAARAGAAVVVADDELTAERLDAELAALRADPDRLAAMARAARGWARRDAAERIAALVDRVAGRRA